METITFINNLLQVVGIQIKKYPLLDNRRRLALIKHHEINKIMDIGANTGIYGEEMRKWGYKGEIVSFEPLSDAFNKLKSNSQNDNKWQILNCAIGNFDGETSINISKNSVSSSILDILPIHIENEKNAKFINKEIIKITRLDTIFDKYYQPGDKIFLKIDTQGYEKNVLEGAVNSISKITGLQLELSLVSLYNGSATYLDLIEYLKTIGFSLFSVENGFYESKTGRLLQFDGIFFRD